MCIYIYIHYHQQWITCLNPLLLYRNLPTKKKHTSMESAQTLEARAFLPQSPPSLAPMLQRQISAAASLLGAATPPWSRVDQLLTLLTPEV